MRLRTALLALSPLLFALEAHAVPSLPAPTPRPLPPPPSFEVYTLVELNPYAGADTFCLALNDAGLAAGVSGGRGVAWRGGGAPMLVPSQLFTWATLNAVNPKGIIVGTIRSPAEPMKGLAGDLRLGTLLYGASSAYFAGAANERSALVPAGNPYAAPIILGGWRSVAFDVTKAGVAVGVTGGSFVDSAAALRAVRWEQGGTFALLPGKGPNQAGRAIAIHESGAIVGRVGVGADERAARWRGLSSYEELGSFGGRSGATDVNAAGHVVGWSKDGRGHVRAFVHKGGALMDLNARIERTPGMDAETALRTGWRLEVATAITETGEICGYGLRAGQPRAFVLRPTTVDRPPSLLGEAEIDAALAKIPVSGAGAVAQDRFFKSP